FELQDYSAFRVDYTYTIEFKSYTAAGAQQGLTTQVASASGSKTVGVYSGDALFDTAIGMDPISGKFTIAWLSGTGTTQDTISARSYTAARASSGSAFEVAAGATMTTPSVAVNASGQAIIVWTRTASSNSDIYFRMASGTG